MKAQPTMTPEQEAAWLDEMKQPQRRFEYEKVYDKMSPGRRYLFRELVALAGGVDHHVDTLTRSTSLIKRVRIPEGSMPGRNRYYYVRPEDAT